MFATALLVTKLHEVLPLFSLAKKGFSMLSFYPVKNTRHGISLFSGPLRGWMGQWRRKKTRGGEDGSNDEGIT
ncbi:MAG TPA: hypothetical protein VFG09_14000 [Thermodesulfovibrionales bacterium]|nr:hypothetical protein [Thermodesulfovibrionales bacterium]